MDFAAEDAGSADLPWALQESRARGGARPHPPPAAGPESLRGTPGSPRQRRQPSTRIVMNGWIPWCENHLKNGIFVADAVPHVRKVTHDKSIIRISWANTLNLAEHDSSAGQRSVSHASEDPGRRCSAEGDERTRQWHHAGASDNAVSRLPASRCVWGTGHGAPQPVERSQEKKVLLNMSSCSRLL